MSRLRDLTDQYLDLARRLEQGGGEARIAKVRAQGKLPARERVAALLDEDSPWLELGLLVAHDRYDGQAPAAGVVTGLGHVTGRPVVVVANDPTVKAGSWWPETITKILRAQEVAMRQRIFLLAAACTTGAAMAAAPMAPAEAALRKLRRFTRHPPSRPLSRSLWFSTN